MKIVALVGESGTGKSHKAMNLAYSKGIHFVIDDGLLIHDSKRIAGKSAKREATRLAAVKRAIFQFEDHKVEMREALDAYQPDQLMVIGTSDKMVQNIVSNLGIGKIDEYIYIQDISTPEEIKLARDSRLKSGKHVIPLPTLEIKRDFSGYFLDSVKTIVRRREQAPIVGEKTIVRPTFSYMGKFTIANRVILQIIEYTCIEQDGVHQVYKVRLQKMDEQIRVEVELGLKGNCHIVKTAEALQQKVHEALEHMTRFNVLSVNILVKNLSFLN